MGWICIKVLEEECWMRVYSASDSFANMHNSFFQFLSGLSGGVIMMTVLISLILFVGALLVSIGRAIRGISNG